MEKVVKNARKLYDVRYEIIYTIEEEKEKSSKELGFEWFSGFIIMNDLLGFSETTDFEDLKRDPQLVGAVKKLKSFLDDIMDKKINNMEDAKIIYPKKVIEQKTGIKK